MDLLHPPNDDPAALADAVLDADHAARLALRAILKGGAPDLDALERGVHVLEVLRGGRLADGRVKLTQDDVAAASHLVDLVRRGASKEDARLESLEIFQRLLRPADP